jgi:chromosome segregation ATPase
LEGDVRTEEDMREALQSLEDQILKNNEAITHMSKLIEHWTATNQSLRDQTVAAYKETREELQSAKALAARVQRHFYDCEQAVRVQAINAINSRIEWFEHKFKRLIAFNQVGAYQEPYPNG